MDEHHTGPAPRDDPSARARADARADVRAILSRALGLRRIVELAAEIRVQSPSVERNRAEHPRHRPQTG